MPPASPRKHPSSDRGQGQAGDLLELPAELPRRIALVGLSLFFVGAGVNHFVNPDFYVQIMPPYLPAHHELVYLSGALEVLGGVGVLIPRIRAAAGLGLVLLLLAIFPANVHMALNPDLFPGLSPWALLARLPLQVLFIAWAYWATRHGPAASDAAAVAG